ncbi:MAG TPA: hypothetical protein VGS41_16590, partial [Chthonomonadales bacterium]|nr:hypothetical protein [Chthonomonadales bacterium]
MVTVLIRPALKTEIRGARVQLFAAQRKFPFLMRSDAIVVPTGPDLTMVYGVAKMARDYGADRAAYEARRVAPLPPGEVFVGSGAPYRFRYTALAVIFDELKRVDPDLVQRAVT